MRTRSFTSRLIREVDYDAGRLELQLTFTNGDVVRYLAVPAYVHLGLLSAKTPSKFFHMMIKPHFRAEIVVEVDDPTEI